MERRNVGVLVASVLSLAAGFGCESQVGEDYKGEPLLSLSGRVVLSEDAVDTDLEPRLVYFGDDHVATFARGELTGDFPAKFRFDVTEPPPQLATHAVDPDWGSGELTQGYLVLVPPDYPTRVPYAEEDDLSLVCNEDRTVCTHRLTQCTEDGQCRERTLECSPSPCEVVETWGDAELGDDVETNHVNGDCWGSSCYVFNERCDSEHCNALLNRCDASTFEHYGRPQELEDGTMLGTTCTVLSASGDALITRPGDPDLFWTEYAIYYLTDDAPGYPGGPLKQGYNLLVHRSEADWLDTVRCRMDQAVDVVTEYNEKNGTDYNIQSPDRPIREVVEEAQQVCGTTFPLTRVDDPLGERLTIKIGQFPGAL